MHEMIRHIGSMPLLRRTVDVINPDRTAILLLCANLESALEYYGDRYKALPEFRVLDWDDTAPGCMARASCSIQPAAKAYEYLHKECCIYAPPYMGPWGTGDTETHERSWQQTILAAHNLGLRSLLCERHCMEQFWDLGESKLPVAYFTGHLHFFSEIYNLLADAESKNTFAAVVRARLTGDTGYIPVADYPQYCHPYASAQYGDIVCDAGGGNGQVEVEMTSVTFAKAVGPRGKVFCFEPIAENCAGLQSHTAACPNITLEQCGLWSGQDHKPMLVWGGASRIDRWGANDTQNCSFIDLDSYLAAKHERCDFFKMDIEGAELPALKGAEKTLRQYRPKLAISVYHSPLSDFLNIPKYLHDLDLGYEFFLGHHLPYWYETILYCRPRV